MIGSGQWSEVIDAAVRSGRRWIAAVGAVAVAIAAMSAAAPAAPATATASVERASLTAQPVETIESGDEDHFDHAEPDPVSPPVDLAAGLNQIGAASPWSGRWGPEIEPLASYEPQDVCVPGARPAVAAFAELLERAYPQSRSLGIARACAAGSRSEHKEGRAYDWGVNVTVPTERAAAEQMVAWMMATDEHGNDFAMARRLGVMYVIWDNHIWSSTAARAGWRVYTGPSPHTDHVHLSFDRAGAMGQTSFWDGATSAFDLELGVGARLLRTFAVQDFPTGFDLGRARYRSELGSSPGEERAWAAPQEEADDDRAPESPTAPPTPSGDTTDPAPSSDVPSSPEPILPEDPVPTPTLEEPIIPLEPTTTIALPSTTVPIIDEVVEDLDPGSILPGDG